MRKEWTEIVDGKEVKYVDWAWYNFEKEKMQHELLEFCGGWNKALVQIYDKPRITLGGLNPIEMWVNWKAVGTVSVEDAKDFDAQLHEAIQLAENYKYNGYILQYRGDSDDYTDEEKAEIKAAYKEAGLE